jgi:hypothetical protein
MLGSTAGETIRFPILKDSIRSLIEHSGEPLNTFNGIPKHWFRQPLVPVT